MELESTRVFVKVAELGSFSKAADFLRLPKSTVSRTISRLELESGTKLLLRTTRNLALTQAGRVFFNECFESIKVLEKARKSVQWVLTSGKITTEIPIRPKVVCSQMSSLMKMAVLGAGIALVPLYLCQQELNSNNLVRILPDWANLGLSVSFVTPTSAKTSGRLKLIMDSLEAPIRLTLR